jgi:UDP-N-acetylglucosamine:LPS N-acetylglucosamine transferase
VLISGGGWGVGDLRRAAGAAQAVGATPVALCGTNGGLRELLDRDGVRTEGFTTRICEWMAAADVLVHSTAGLTVREAELCGTWAISYGWGIGHIRANNHAYERFGLADVAATPQALRDALMVRLAAPRSVDRSLAALPAAADEVLALRLPGGGYGTAAG